jgi:hypothetical protein
MILQGILKNETLSTNETKCFEKWDVHFCKHFVFRNAICNFFLFFLRYSMSIQQVSHEFFLKEKKFVDLYIMQHPQVETFLK